MSAKHRADAIFYYSQIRLAIYGLRHAVELHDANPKNEPQPARYRGVAFAASCRWFEVIGEILKQLEAAWPSETERMAKYPEVNWKSWKRLRDVLAHNIWGLRPELLGRAYELGVPVLLDAINAIITELEAEAQESSGPA